MPRGQDTSRHEGRKVHRDTPRIAALLAEHLNENIVYPAQEQIDNMRETLGYGSAGFGGFTTDAVADIADNTPGFIKEYTPESAQGLLNDYRDLRDKVARNEKGYARNENEYPKWVHNHERAAVEDYQDDLSGILRNR